MMTTRRWIVPAALLLAAVPAALASGFHIYEQGAKASGQAVAFVARADDASSAYYNPAAMTRLGEGAHVQLGFSAVMLGNTEFTSNSSALGDASPFTPYLAATSTPTGDMVDHTPTPANVHYVHRFPGRFALGVSVTTPFGLITDWSTPGFPARFSSVKADLRTYVLNVNGAMDFGNNFSGALGVDWIKVDLRDFSRRISNLPLGENPATPGELLSNLEGDGDEFGWNAGLQWMNEAWAIGASYRAKMDVDIEGDIFFTDVPAGAPEGGPLTGVPYSVLFPASVQAKGTLKLPATWAVGIAFTGLEKWEFELDVSRIEWSNFDELAIDVINPTFVVTDQVVEENWEDTTAIRLGGSWQLAEAHQIRFGGYVEDTPVPEKYLRPAIPDSDRTGLTLGYGFKRGNFALDAYWMHIMLDDVTVGPEDLDLLPPADPRYASRLLEEQSRIGSYTSDIDLLGLSASFSF